MQNKQTGIDFLGQDAKLPIQDKFEKVEGIDNLLQSLQILLGTRIGERVQRPDYGCNLFNRIWDNIDDVARQGIVDIREAIENFEPRVLLKGVSAQVDRNTGLISFVISFVVIETNTPLNLVFPFQIQVKNSGV
jgi:phage baseplate assembly protein W